MADEGHYVYSSDGDVFGFLNAEEVADDVMSGANIGDVRCFYRAQQCDFRFSDFVGDFNHLIGEAIYENFGAKAENWLKVLSDIEKDDLKRRVVIAVNQWAQFNDIEPEKHFDCIKDVIKIRIKYLSEKKYEVLGGELWDLQ